MSRIRKTCLWAAVAVTVHFKAMAIEPPAASIPVLARAPSCSYEKLGSVDAAEGTEVSAQTRQAWLPSASYKRAFERLAEASAQRGGNAVVLRMHEATFFTLNGRRSRRPVHVQLRGGAIRMPEVGCELEYVYPADVLERAVRGEPFDVPADPPMQSTAAS